MSVVFRQIKSLFMYILPSFGYEVIYSSGALSKSHQKRRRHTAVAEVTQKKKSPVKDRICRTVTFNSPGSQTDP